MNKFTIGFEARREQIISISALIQVLRLVSTISFQMDDAEIHSLKVEQLQADAPVFLMRKWNTSCLLSG
jgi:hypothetical protein